MVTAALALAGDTAKSRADYQEFLSRWKSADLNIPIFRQANTKYAKLQEARTAMPARQPSRATRTSCAE